MIDFLWAFVFAVVGSLLAYPIIAYWPVRRPCDKSVHAIRRRIEREDNK
ncbi:hypothetical protein ACWDSJ_02925 [Nocardia sp. NPDC003482]